MATTMTTERTGSGSPLVIPGIQCSMARNSSTKATVNGAFHREGTVVQARATRAAKAIQREGRSEGSEREAQNRTMALNKSRVRAQCRLVTNSNTPVKKGNSPQATRVATQVPEGPVKPASWVERKIHAETSKRTAVAVPGTTEDRGNFT